MSRPLQPHTFVQSKVGPLRLLQQIGKGGFSDVYVTVQPHTQVLYALKVLRTPHPDDHPSTDKRIKRLQQEAEVLSSLEHPHLMRVIEILHDDELGHCLVMEYIRGRSVREILDNTNTLKLHTIQTIMSQLCDALDYIHQRGILHRDLKPGNIMWSRIDRDDHVVLIDFGSLKQLTQPSNITRKGGILGTPAYSPPEQLRGEDLDPTADLYALAAVCVELLSGKRICQDNQQSLFMRLLHDNIQPASLNELDPDTEWSPLLLQFFHDALSADRDQRPPHAQSFRTRILNALQHQQRLGSLEYSFGDMTITRNPSTISSEQRPSPPQQGTHFHEEEEKTLIGLDQEDEQTLVGITYEEDEDTLLELEILPPDPKPSPPSDLETFEQDTPSQDTQPLDHAEEDVSTPCNLDSVELPEEPTTPQPSNKDQSQDD